MPTPTPTPNGIIGPDGKVTYEGVPDVTARVFPLGQRETGQRPPKTSEKPDPETTPGKERDPAGQY